MGGLTKRRIMLRMGEEGKGQVCVVTDLFCSQESMFIHLASLSEPPGGKTMGSGVG